MRNNLFFGLGPQLVGHELRIVTTEGTELHLRVIGIKENLDGSPVGLTVKVVGCSSRAAELSVDEEVVLFVTNKQDVSPESFMTEPEIALCVTTFIGPGFVGLLDATKIVGFRIRTVDVR